MNLDRHGLPTRQGNEAQDEARAKGIDHHIDGIRHPEPHQGVEKFRIEFAPGCLDGCTQADIVDDLDRHIPTELDAPQHRFELHDRQPFDELCRRRRDQVIDAGREERRNPREELLHGITGR